MRDVLTQWGLETAPRYEDAAFCRNLGLIDYDGQQRLAASRVAVAGMGGVGGVHLMTLARTGIGHFHVADMDRFAPVNVNRQFGATVPAFGRPKLEVMVEQATAVNPYLRFRTFPEGVNAENMDAFLDGVQVVVDGIDFFAFDIRRLLFKRAQAAGIPVITAGPMGFSSAVLVFMPGGMGFDEYFDITDDTPELRRYLRFGLGLAPRGTHLHYMRDRRFTNLAERRGPSLHLACELCAAMAATETVRILLGRGTVRAVPSFIQFDPFTRQMRRGTLRMGNRNPLQRIKLAVAERIFLHAGERDGLQRPSAPAMVSPRVASGGTGRPVYSETAASEVPIPSQALEYVVRAGIQAPSGDNAQPWSFRWSGSTVDCFARWEADPSFFNVQQTATLLSCGAAVENMRIAAGAIGLGPRVEWLPEEGASPLVAQVFCEPDGIERDSVLHGALWRRCTNRQMYRRNQLPVGVCERLSQVAAEVPGVRLLWATEPDARRDLATAVFKADRIRVERRDLHEYFMSMVRFSAPADSRDGLPLRNLCAGTAGNLFLKAVRSWPAMRIASRMGAGRLMPLHSARSVLQSGGMGLLCVDEASVRATLLGGQAMERVWIMLEHMGFAFQPMTAITLFQLRSMLGGSASFSEQHKRLLTEAWDIVEAKFPASKGLVPLMLFRAGEGPRLRYGTYRRPLAHFSVGNGVSDK